MLTYGMPPSRSTTATAAGVGHRRPLLSRPVGGIAVSRSGHAHPALVAAVSEQVGRLAHISNLSCTSPVGRLARAAARTCSTTPARVFFTNCGPRPTRRRSSWSACTAPGDHPHGDRLRQRGFPRPVIRSLSRSRATRLDRAPFAPPPGVATASSPTATRRPARGRRSDCAAVFVEPSWVRAASSPRRPASWPRRARPATRPGALLVRR